MQTLVQQTGEATDRPGQEPVAEFDPEATTSDCGDIPQGGDLSSVLIQTWLICATSTLRYWRHLTEVYARYQPMLIRSVALRPTAQPSTPKSDGYARLARDLQASELFSELLKRLGVAECVQWHLRRTPLGVEDWRKIAAEDTGSMFEVCACLGDRSGRLRHFGGLLGLLYRGCDDVGDIRGANSLGGGGEEDVRDGILTLPAALAIRDPLIGKTFCNPDPTPLDLSALAAAFMTKLPEAEACLDQIAAEARSEALLFSTDPTPLVALVDQTRRLSAR